MTYRTVPTFEQPLTIEKDTSASWYRYFQTHDLGQPPGPETVVTVGASPFIYAAPRGGNVIVSGGTVSAITYSRSGPFYATGQTSGQFAVSFGDQLKITYTVKPTVVFAPT